jgi:hypothetical protein
MLIQCKFYVNKNTVFSNPPMLSFHFIAKLNIGKALSQAIKDILKYKKTREKSLGVKILKKKIYIQINTFNT